MMKATLIVICTIVILTSFDTNQVKRDMYPTGKPKSEVGFSNGMYNGHYTSWYENG